MEKKIESKFAIIKGENNISIFDVRPSASQFETLLENVVIEIDKNNLLTIKGDKVVYDFSFNKLWVEDMDEKPEEEYYKFGFKNIIDLFKWNKKPYVLYWFKLKKREKFEKMMSSFFIV